MAKFWFVSAPLFSHTDWGGFLKTARVLKARGHEVIWLSEPQLEKAILQRGIDFHAVEQTGWLWPPPPQPDVSQMPPQEAVMLRYRRALDTWLSEDLVGQSVGAILRAADQIGKPDIIAIDPFLSSAALASEKLDVPMVVCGWPAQQSLDENALFPVQRDLSSDSQQRIMRLCDRFSLEGTNFSRGTAPSIRSPHLHICYFTQDWYMAEMETLMLQNRFVGGLPQHPDAAPPDWLQQIPQDQPLALITLGTIFTGDLGFFSWAAQAAARAGLTPIVVIGWNPIDPEKKQELMRALPKGTRLLNWAPFEHVLPRSKVMIHHGGMGTTHYAVVHGVPQIVVPHAADQRIQARRVAQAKIGLNLSAHDVRQGMLTEGVHAIVNDETVRQTAQQLASSMAALGGTERAADHILELLQTL